MYRVGGLFSGVGGIELGFELAGDYEISWANELDKNACVTYRANFNHRLYEKDIHKLSGKELKSVDVLVGGFPCQAFSVAGYRKGFSDPRGNLFFEIARLIEELSEKPKALLLENVKNFFTHDGGNTFKVVQNTLGELGYSVFPHILNTSQLTDIPQNRERTFIICFRDESGWNFFPEGTCSSLFEYRFRNLTTPSDRMHISDLIIKKKVEDKYYYTESAYMYDDLVKSMKSRDTVYQWRRKYVRENKSDVCPTLTANMGTGGHNVPLIIDDWGYRKLTPRECFNFQGYPDTFILPKEVSNGQKYKQAGNSVTVTLIKKLAEIIKDSLDEKYSENVFESSKEN